MLPQRPTLVKKTRRVSTASLPLTFTRRRAHRRCKGGKKGKRNQKMLVYMCINTKSVHRSPLLFMFTFFPYRWHISPTWAKSKDTGVNRVVDWRGNVLIYLSPPSLTLPQHLFYPVWTYVCIIILHVRPLSFLLSPGPACPSVSFNAFSFRSRWLAFVSHASRRR